MQVSVPTRAQCLRASQRLKLQRARGSRVYLFQIWSPLVRGRKRSTGSCSPEEAGALLIAASDSIRDANAALMRASQLHEDYVDLPDAGDFSEVVADRALLMLRAGWRRKDSEVSRECAELASLSGRLVWWSEDTA